MKKILSLIVPCLLTVGCVQVPMTVIKVPTANGVITIKAPKDSKIAGLKANFEKGTVTLDSYEARMNPEVIGASAAGQVELIKAYGEMANSIGQLGMRAFAASQGIPMGAGAPMPQAQQPQARSISPEQFNALVNQRAAQIVSQQVAQSESAKTNSAPAPRAARRQIKPQPQPAGTNAPAKGPRNATP